MIVQLEKTTSAKISAELVKARRSGGSPSMGMVLTLIVVADEKEYADALRASMEAGREHPCRILLVVTNSSRKPSLDAEVRIGEGTPGEVIVVRMSGAIASHPASVIRPLLLPDSPVIIWWPGKCPINPATDELAQLARRRITDAANTPRPMHALTVRAENYLPGDTDLAWTRLTRWRALLAAALDQYPAKIKAVTVEAERSNPSAELLAAWLHPRLKLDVTRKISEGPGITAVRLGTAAGDIAITRPDGLLASYAVPGQPERLVALKRREITELISEEMRRMDEDDVYDRVLKSLLRNRVTSRRKATDDAQAGAATPPTAARRSSGRVAAGSSVTKKSPTKKTATRARSAAKVPAAKRATAKKATRRPRKQS